MCFLPKIMERRGLRIWKLLGLIFHFYTPLPHSLIDIDEIYLQKKKKKKIWTMSKFREILSTNEIRGQIRFDKKFLFFNFNFNCEK